MAMDAKRARLRKPSDATSVQGISMAALGRVLSALEIKNVSRRQIAAAYHLRSNDVVIKEALRCADGGIFDWEFTDPA